MCMLCVVPEGVVPSREKLENSALNNPHGFGFAIIIPSENRIISERTMDADESINRFLELRAKYPDGYAMWHARYATHGVKTVANCHPFVVGDDKRTYLAHNGILDIDIKEKDDRSDTRVFAEELLPAIGGVTALDNDYVWDMLEDFTSGSKVCVLTVDPKAEHQCYILNEKLGRTDKDGVWWSNDSCYLDTWSRASTNNKWTYDGYFDEYYPAKKVDGKPVSDEEYGEYYCPNPKCGALLDEDEIAEYADVCMYCGYCFDCRTDYEECMCYNKHYEYYSGNKAYKSKKAASLDLELPLEVETHPSTGKGRATILHGKGGWDAGW